MCLDIGIFSWYGYRQPLKNRLDKIADAGFNTTSVWYGKKEESYRSGEIGAKAGITVAIENTRQRPLIETIFSRIDSPFLGFCYDSSHDAIWGRLRFKILETFGDRLKTLHLSDNRGEDDDHMIPGRGTIDWEKLYDTLIKSGFNGSIMLEVYPQDARCEAETDFLQAAVLKAREIAEAVVSRK